MIQDYFDKIICINLAKRPDRWKQVTQEFAKAGITNVQRYYAIDGNPMEWKYVPDGKALNQIKPQSWDGAAGCMASHVNIWKLAKENNWKNVLIVEDDCDFVGNVQNLFNEQIKNVPDDWDILYFGGVHETRKGLFVPKHVAPNVLRCKRLVTTTCYAIKNTCYDYAINTILEKEPEFYTAVDAYLASRIQPNTNSYCFHPPLVWQRSSFSDVQNGNRDYSKMMRDKNIV